MDPRNRRGITLGPEREKSMRIFACATAVLLAACGGRAVTSPELPPAPSVVTEEDATLATSTGDIVGTVKLPAARFPVPVVLIIAGSGPTDRNGNSPVFPGPNNSLKMIADALAGEGIASLRYDKRGIAGSRSAGRSEDQLRFDHFVSDAEAWIKQLRADRRFSTITVAGHSEGSLIGMIAARQANADGYISIAGVGRPSTEVLMEQLSAQLPAPLLAQARDIIARIEAGQKPDSVPMILNALFRPSVQPYLTSWFAFNPATEIAKLSIPVLIIQGTTDLQVKVEDANRLAAAKQGARLVTIEGMNHVLKAVSGPLPQQLPSYSDSSLPVAPRLIDEVVGYVRALPRTRDSVVGIDKLKHFLVSGFVESVAFAGLQGAGANRDASLAGAGTATAVVAVGREVHDRRATGLFSFGDLLWDALGAGAAMLLLTRIGR